MVHETHGVGIYQGIVQLENDDAYRDYFKIQYRDGGVLYVPTTSLDLLQRYVGGEDAKPRINRLGGQEWQRTKNKVRGSGGIVRRKTGAAGLRLLAGLGLAAGV